MSAGKNEDKSYLAMLAIPVILSMVLGFSGDARLDETFADRVGEEMQSREDGSEKREETFLRGDAIDEKNTVEARRGMLAKAVALGDYEQFRATAKGTPFAEIMTESAFQELVAQYWSRKIG